MKRSQLPGFEFSRGVGKFDVKVTLPSGVIKRCRKTVRGVTREEAVDAWKTFRDQVKAMKAGTKAPNTLRTYVDRYRKELTQRLSKHRATSELIVLKKHLLPKFGDTPLLEINLAAVKDFVAEKEATGLSPSTVSGFVSILRKILNDAVERDALPFYPLKGKLRLKEIRPRLEMDEEERSAFLSAFDDQETFRAHIEKEHARSGAIRFSPKFLKGKTPRAFGGGLDPEGLAARVYFERFRTTRPFFVLAMETGLRRGDLLRLAWSHVNVESGWIKLRTAKTGADVEIPISVDAFDALEELRLAHGCGGRLFPGFSEMRVRRAFDLAKKLAGITRRLRLHDLRHGLGSRLASRGVSLPVIGKLLGHSTNRMTERYARPDRAALVDAIGRLAPGFTFQRDTSGDTRRTVKVGRSVVPPAGFEPAIFTLKGRGQLGNREDTAGTAEGASESSGVAAGRWWQRDTIGDTPEPLAVDASGFLYALLGTGRRAPAGFEWVRP